MSQAVRCNWVPLYLDNLKFITKYLLFEKHLRLFLYFYSPYIYIYVTVLTNLACPKLFIITKLTLNLQTQNYSFIHKNFQNSSQSIILPFKSFGEVKKMSAAVMKYFSLQQI